MPEHQRATDPEVRTARELAEHGAEIKHLQSDMDKMIKDMDEVKDTLKEISKTLAEAKGGWHMLMAVGGLGTALGGTVVWVLEYFKH
jgi:prefoldin subunit 5